MMEKQPITYDDEYEPASVRERRASTGRSGTLQGLAGSASGDTIYLVSTISQAANRKFLLVPLIFVCMAGYAMSFITFSLYVYQRVHDEEFQGQPDITFSACNETLNKSDPFYKTQILVQQKSSDWFTYYSLAGGVPSIIANLIFGCFSDKFGRRFLLILPIVGSFLKFVIFGIGIYFNLDLSFFLAGYIVEGMTGQMYSLFLASFSYIADVTPPKGRERSFSIVVIELSIGIGVSLFQFLSGYFIRYAGYFYPLVACAGVTSLGFGIVLFIPESFPKHKRRPNSSGYEVIKTMYDLFLGDFNYGRRWMYILLLMVFTLTMFTVFGRGSVEPIYTKDNPFCWSAEKIGDFGAFKAMASQIVGMVLVKLMQRKMSDEAIAILGCFSYIASNSIEGLAYNDIMMFIVPAVSVFGLLTIPMCRALLSKLTREDQQGAVFATIAGMETMINMAGSIAAVQIYAATLVYYRGIIFFVFAGANLVCLVMMGVYRFGSRRTYPLIVR